MAKILDRYILKESLLFFGISLLAFLGVLVTVRMLKLASFIINKGVEIIQVAEVFLAIIPSFLEIAVPLATLLGIMLAFARLSGDSEIVVIRASGVSINQLIRPVLIFGTLAFLVSIFNSMLLRPYGNQKLEDTLFEIARTKSTAGLSEGVFNKLGSLTLYSEIIDHYEGTLRNVLIDDRRVEAERKIVIAKRGAIEPDRDMRTITLKLYDGSIHEFVDGKYVITDFNSNALLLDPAELSEGGEEQRERKSKEMYISELHEQIAKAQQELAELKRAAEEPPGITVPLPLAATTSLKTPPDIKSLTRRIRRLEIEAARKYSMPFACLVLALVALPLGIQPPRMQRTWGMGLSAILGMGVFVLYYGLLSLGFALGERGSISPVVGMWAPNVVCLALGIFAAKKVGSEEWQSIAQGVVELAQRLDPRLIIRRHSKQESIS